jgi:phosphoribosyl 1,2-cyclic phosphodiesterase
VRATVWGCRGSLASPGPETVRYGGNTSCVELRLSDDSVIVLDAGTGIRPLGDKLMREGRPDRIDVLLTHLHMDHLEGLGFFGPIWDPAAEVHIWGPASPTKSLEQRLSTYLSPPLFPVHLVEIPANLVCHDVPTAEWQLGPATIFADLINHPGPTVGFRITDGERTAAYIPDHEPALGVQDLGTASPEWVSGVSVAWDVDVLFHDSQYTDEEYTSRVGWGHSTTRQAVQFGLLAKVHRFVMFHHDPTHSDEQLDGILALARDLWGADADEGATIEMAHEGLQLEI